MIDDNAQAKLQTIMAAAGLGKMSKAELVGQGYMSLAYKAICDGDDFIILAPKPKIVRAPDYANHFVALQELEKISYRYASKPIYLSPDHSTMVTTLAPGEVIDWTDTASQDQQQQVVDTFIDALLSLREVSFESYAQSYKALTNEDLPILTLQEDVRRYTTRFFQGAQKGKPDPQLTEFLAPRVASRETTIRDIELNTKPAFMHGDTTPANILITRDTLQLKLIDWNGAKFSQFPGEYQDFGLGYPLLYVTVLQKYRSRAIAAISERVGISIDELTANLWRIQEFSGLSGILWAYEMHARAAAGLSDDDPAEYLQIAHQRLANYQQLLTTQPK